MNSKTEIIHEEDEIENSIQKSIDNLLGSSCSEPSGPAFENEKGVKMKQETDVRSSILWFPYRYPLETKLIYNLFSNFGNISCITIKKDNAYIKFRTKEFAAIANTYLNNLVLADNIMVLRECPEASDCWRPAEGESSQCTYYDSTYDR